MGMCLVRGGKQSAPAPSKVGARPSHSENLKRDALFLGTPGHPLLATEVQAEGSQDGILSPGRRPEALRAGRLSQCARRSRPVPAVFM